jgi:O-methyltransferase
VSDDNIFGGQIPKSLRVVTDKRLCEFYHVSELPDGEVTTGQWDLRDTVGQYLGNTDFSGKRVLEIGPASGFLTFHMERQGARVICIEPSLQNVWDFVPQAAVDLDSVKQDFIRHQERVRNSFWYLHRVYSSQAECYEADAYRIPEPMRKFDIGLLTAVLLHVSSPVKMLESLANVVAEKIIIVDAYIEEISAQPVARLVPSAANQVTNAWWEFSRKFFEQYLPVLGFSKTVTTRHHGLYAGIGRRWELFTVVATR